MYRLKKIDKTPENSTDEIDPQEVYASMARIYINVETPRIKYRDSSQLINWILDLGVTCHMTPNISDLYQDNW